MCSNNIKGFAESLLQTGSTTDDARSGRPGSASSNKDIAPDSGDFRQTKPQRDDDALN